MVYWSNFLTTRERRQNKISIKMQNIKNDALFSSTWIIVKGYGFLYFSKVLGKLLIKIYAKRKL